MPKKIDPEVRARAVRLVNDHLGEYPSLTAASEAVARQVGVSKETVRGWALQAQVCRVELSGPARGGLPVAARTYRSWKQPDRRVADHTIARCHGDPLDPRPGLATRPESGEPKLTAQSLYGRRKMTTLLLRTTMPEVSGGAVDLGICTLGLVGVPRDKGTRTTIQSRPRPILAHGKGPPTRAGHVHRDGLRVDG